MLGQQRAVPPRVAFWRRSIQGRDDPPLMVGIVVPRLAAARRIGHPGQVVLRKPATPLADRPRPRRQPLGHRLVAQPLVQSQNNLRPECQPLLGLAGPQPRNAMSRVARWSASPLLLSLRQLNISANFY